MGEALLTTDHYQLAISGATLSPNNQHAVGEIKILSIVRAARPRRQSMTPPPMTAAFDLIAQIEYIVRKFRELIDTDASIPAELRGVLHATLDHHLIAAKKRVLNVVRTQ
ncbi:hypothetical protein QA639_33960 [Bradyrhizobium pachyrhizi]|uniref:hypothetical protein n=1 Tax=Bradyrhizobium TaxID=374 RepID=UPI0024B0C7A1|nr:MULTISPECIES: hypothetical protein [Bradyrhizobium]WFU54562.1 hypothetical protein QA639_33960 [Bradyrhizobium pachyrhizi]WOH80202.1 hypothetical protein RX327_30925 [Bradyrhizobium sp. BEA-2-5]